MGCIWWSSWRYTRSCCCRGCWRNIKWCPLEEIWRKYITSRWNESSFQLLNFSIQLQKIWWSEMCREQFVSAINFSEPRIETMDYMVHYLISISVSVLNKKWYWQLVQILDWRFWNCLGFQDKLRCCL